MTVLMDCTSCGGRVENRGGEEVCIACGIVASGYAINTGPEYRVFTKAQRSRERAGAPITWTSHDRGLSTTIGRGSNFADHRGNKPTPERQQDFLRMRRSHAVKPTNTDRSIDHGLKFIDVTVGQLELPRMVREEAGRYMHLVADAGLIRGRTVHGMAVACVHLVCRKRPELARTLDDIAWGSGIAKKEIARNYRVIVNELGLKIARGKESAYLSKYVEHFGASAHVATIAQQILDELRRTRNTAGKKPVPLATAALYLALEIVSDMKITQSRIAHFSGTTEVTLRNRYREMKSLLLIEVRL